jgi:hypothetical protein
MSYVENWTKRDEHELSVLMNDHSGAVIFRTRGSLNPVGALDNFKANSRLLIEVGN